MSHDDVDMTFRRPELGPGSFSFQEENKQENQVATGIGVGRLTVAKIAPAKNSPNPVPPTSSTQLARVAIGITNKTAWYSLQLATKLQALAHASSNAQEM